MTTAYDLRGKVALVTGAARMRGIGRAIALRLAADGAAVCVVGRSDSPRTVTDIERDANWQGLDSVAAEIEEARGRSIALRADVSRDEEVRSVMTQTLQRLGRLDIVVNNAGINPEWMAGGTPVMDLDPLSWDRVMAVNVRSAFLFAKHAGPHMIQRGSGHIINISSRAGKVGIPGLAAYCASKFALIGLTQSLALELAPFGVQVNAVCPAWIDTDRNERRGMAEAEAWGVSVHEARVRLARTVPLGRIGEPTEVAGVVAFLVSGHASYMTGQAINVTGGRLMH